MKLPDQTNELMQLLGTLNILPSMLHTIAVKSGGKKGEIWGFELPVWLPVSVLFCLQTVWIVLHKDTGIDRTSLITSSVCFSSLKTSILGYIRLLKASLLSSSFHPHLSLPSSITSPPFPKSCALLLSAPFLSPLLLQCNPRPCLIDRVMMKVAGGGMVVPCFLLLWWRRSSSLSKLKSCLSIPSLSRSFLCYLSSCFLFPCIPLLFLNLTFSSFSFCMKPSFAKIASLSETLRYGWKLLSHLDSGKHL